MVYTLHTYENMSFISKYFCASWVIYFVTHAIVLADGEFDYAVFTEGLMTADALIWKVYAVFMEFMDIGPA